MMYQATQKRRETYMQVFDVSNDHSNTLETIRKTLLTSPQCDHGHYFKVGCV